MVNATPDDKCKKCGDKLPKAVVQNKNHTNACSPNCLKAMGYNY